MPTSESARPARRRLFSGSEASERVIIGGGTLLGFFLLWEIVARAGLVDPLFISSPTRIVQAGRELAGTGDLWRDVRVSATEFILGYLLAVAIAVPLGLAMGRYKRVHYLFGPFVDGLNAVPRITLLPILVIWFGIGIWSKVAVVFLGAVIPIAISTYSGVRTNEARFLRVAKSFSASEWKLFTSIILPGTVPFIFSGLKYGAGRALLGVVVGELYAATAGVGHMIAAAGNSFQTDVVFFGVLLFTATGLVMVTILDRIERHFERWRPSVGGGA